MDKSAYNNAYKKRLGTFGEQIAVNALSGSGFQVLARNWRYGRQGELDIVALLPGPDATLVFIEVKTRTNDRYGDVVESLGFRQKQRLLLLAAAFLQAHPEHAHLNQRFDLMCVYPESPITRPDIFETGLGWRWHQLCDILQSEA